MKWAVLSGLTVIVAFIVFYEWPRINPNQKKEKTAFIGLLALGWLYGMLVVFFPDLPNPVEPLHRLFKPFGKMLEQ